MVRHGASYKYCGNLHYRRDVQRISRRDVSMVFDRILFPGILLCAVRTDNRPDFEWCARHGCRMVHAVRMMNGARGAPC